MAAVESVSRILFGQYEDNPSADTIAMLATEVPVTEIPRSELETGIGLADLAVRTKLAESKGMARKLVDGGGFYLNNERQTQAQRMVNAVTFDGPERCYCAPARRTITWCW